MGDMKIDQEFKALIPPLTNDEYKQLEENIIKEGCRDALVVWNDILVDGHNRYKICTENDIVYKTVSKKFTDKEKAKEWIIKNQLGRKNLSIYERGRLALRMEEIFRERAKENQKVSKGNQDKSGNVPKSAQHQKSIKTRNKVAKIAGINRDTIAKIKIIEEEATQEQKLELSEGNKKLDTVYDELRPRPKLTKTKDGWHVSDGWIGDAFFTIVKQPSNETIIKLHQFWVEQAIKNMREIEQNSKE